ncbi:MAG: translocation/assembly module TamB [Deltaproteobacteria bacterium]|jgi:translocation and assembly module TamB|nr:translocation/assembly module TamB [Deltaproteobacteria bacterium]
MAPENTENVSLRKSALVRQPRPRGRARRALKILGLAALALVLVLAVGIVWLRSDSGLNFLAKKSLSALSKKGLEIGWASLGGPIPEKITAESLVFRDRHGQFGSAERLEFNLSLGSLLRGLIDVETLKVSGLNLTRRPETIPEPDKASSPASLPPLDIKAHVELDGLMAHRFLSPEATDPGSGKLALNGDLSLAGGAVSASLDGSWLDERRRGVELSVDLSQGKGGAPDGLKLLVSAMDGPGGPLSHILDRPDWPAWSLVVTGEGPLSGWEGRATLGLSGQTPGEGPEAEASVLSPIAQANLSIAGKTGTIKADLIDGRSLGLSFGARMGPESPLPIPDGVLDLIGRGLELSGQVDLEGRSVTGKLTARAPRAAVELTGLDFQADGKGFAAKGQGRISFDPAIAAGMAPKRPEPAPAPGGQETPEAAPGALTLAGYPAPPPPAPAESAGAKDAGWISLDYGLSLSSRDGRPELESLSLTGPGLALTASGSVSPDSAKEARLGLSLDQGSPLWAEILPLIGSVSQKSGSFGLNASLSQAADGVLALSAEANLSELGLVASPWGGPVKAGLRAGGPMGALDMDLTVTSPNLRGPRENFPDVTLTYVGKAMGLPDFGRATGKLTLATGAFESGPLALATLFDLSLPAGGARGDPPETGLSLDVSLAALTLSAGRDKELLDLESPALALSIRPGSAPKPEGSLKLKVGDWKTVRALTGLDFTGSPASLEANLGPDGAGDHSAQVKLDLPELRLGQELHLKGLSLDLTARNYLTALNFDLSLDAGQSQLGPVTVTKARISGQGDGLRADLDVELLGPHGSELLTLSGKADLSEKKATIESLRLASIPQLPGGLRLNQPVTVDFGSGLALGPTSITMGKGGTLDVSGSLEPLNVKARLSEFSFANLSGLSEGVPQGKANLTLDYGQGGSGSFELSTQFAAPAALESLSKTLNVTANGKIEPRSVSGKITLNQTRLKDVSLDYRLPLVPAGRFLRPDMDGPLSAALTWKGPIAPIWNLIGLSDRSLTGELDLDLKVEGSAKNPKPVVNMYVANGQYQDLVLGLFLSKINMEVHDQADGNLKLVLEASDHGDGKLSLEGTIKPFVSPPSISVRGQLLRLAPLQRDDASAIITGLAHLDGPFSALAITAKVVVEQCKIDLDLIKGGGSITTLDLEEKLTRVSHGPKLALDVDLPRQIYIRGKGLDSEWGGHLDITTPFGRTLINGSLKPLKGTFDLLSKQFTFSGGDIRFINSPHINPALNVELTRQTSSILAHVKVTGSVSKPTLTLTSQPPYPSDEVLAQVLFGKKVSQLSRMEALQLANSLRVMAGLGGDIGLTVLSTMRDALGLSVLRVSDASGGDSNRILSGNTFRDNLNLDGESQAEDSTTLEAGRYIGDNIYVGLEQNLTDNTTGVRVEVELTPNISLNSLSSSTSNRVGLGWKKDY